MHYGRRRVIARYTDFSGILSEGYDPMLSKGFAHCGMVLTLKWFSTLPVVFHVKTYMGCLGVAQITDFSHKEEACNSFLTENQLKIS